MLCANTFSIIVIYLLSIHLFGEVLSIIEKLYINCNGDFAPKMHNVLASFYRKQADPLNNFSWIGNDLKALRELPYHLVCYFCFLICFFLFYKLFLNICHH